MYYEFCLDVFFLENLMMNFFVLQMTGRVIRDRKSVWRRIFAAILGSTVACVIFLLPIRRHVFLSATLSFISGCAMAVIGCPEGKQKDLKQMITVFWVMAFLLGGIWQCFMRILGVSFWYAMPAGYVVLWGVWRFRDSQKRNRQYLCDVKITHNKREVQIKALLDSGNRLRQPGSGKPVHIIDASVLRELLKEDEILEMECMLKMECPEKTTATFSYIPFHTIGNDHGVMPMLVLETLHIKHGESAWDTTRIIAAVSKKTISSTGEYQMILHPQILE